MIRVTLPPGSIVSQKPDGSNPVTIHHGGRYHLVTALLDREAPEVVVLKLEDAGDGSIWFTTVLAEEF